MSAPTLKILEPTAAQAFSKREYTSSSWVAVMRTPPSLIIPAFFSAISRTVSPRTSVCSRLTLVMTETRAFTTLVASSLPPIPTSRTAKSTPSSEKYLKAIAVTISKKVGCLSPGSSSISSQRGLITFTSLSTSATGIWRPLIWMRSVKVDKWGLVNIPTLDPASVRMEATMFVVEPLPLVPVMCTDLKSS